MTNPDVLRQIFVDPSMRILDAVKVLNNAHRRIILVVDAERHLLGVVTDSNIRHAVLEQMDFSEPISTIMRSKPVKASVEFTVTEVFGLMEATQCHQIPVVDADNRVTGIHFIDDILREQHATEPRTAVIMAGGLGSRLRPYTDNMPKPLVLVGGQPIIFTIIDQLFAAGIDRIYLTLNHLGDDIRKAIGEVPRFQNHVHFLEEDQKLGTAGPLSLLKERPKNPFVVMNGDLLTKAPIDEMLRFHRHQRNVMTMALREEQYHIPYGVAKTEGNRVLCMIEKPCYTHFVNAGVYVMEPYVLDRVPEATYFDMNSLIEDLLAADLRVGCFPVHEYWLDIGAPGQLDQANRDYPSVFGSKKGKG